MVKFKVWNLRQNMSHDLSRVLIFLIYISLVTTHVLITADWTIIKTILEFNMDKKTGRIGVKMGWNRNEALPVGWFSKSILLVVSPNPQYHRNVYYLKHHQSYPIRCEAGNQLVRHVTEPTAELELLPAEKLNYYI